MKKVRLFISITVLAILLFPVLVLGGEGIIGKTCDQCGNRIADKRFAVVIEKKNKTYYFDDLGCALKWRAGKCMPTQVTCDAVTHTFDYYTGERIHVRAAYYVKDSDVRTPGGYGIVAFKDESSAKSFLKEHGGKKELFDYEQLQELFK